MLKEDYVSFEVAKLLKEKGFAEKCVAYYSQCITPIKLAFGGRVNYNASNKFKMLPPVSAPTHQMAMKWLREKHYIYADPIKQGNYNDCSEYWTWIVARMGIIHRNSTVVDKLSYEEAVEAALKYCLENLI